MKKRCIAMAYGKMPLDRIAVGASEKVIYILNPEVVDNVDNPSDGAVGFPREFVFEPDDAWLCALREAFDSQNSDELDALWARGRRLAS